jgi:hypothetical protein
MSGTTHNCIIPDCTATGRNRLGVRCRVAHSEATPFPSKGRTDSMFSVESDAYLCDAHALAGVNLALTVSPNRSEEASLAVVCGHAISPTHRTEIKQPLEQAA